MRDLVADDEWGVLSHPICTKATTASLINSESTIFVIPYSSIDFYSTQYYCMSYTNVVFNQHIQRAMDKDTVEHQRIDDRVGFQTRFQTAGNLIFKPVQHSSLALTEAQRFLRDKGALQKQEREAERSRTEQFYNARLQKRMVRESDKWSGEEKREQREEQLRQHRQEVQMANNKNINSIGFNPITHVYEQSNRGENLRAKDESKEVQRFARTKNIVTKGNTAFNILTGEEQPRVQPPAHLEARVHHQYAAKVEREAVKYVPIRDKYDYLDD